MAILESVRELASKLGAETNGRDITDQINKINKHLDETALGGRDIADAVRTYSKNASGGGGGGETFVVNIVDYETYEVSKTLTESLAAFNSNKRVEIDFYPGEGFYVVATGIYSQENELTLINLAFVMTGDTDLKRLTVFTYADETHVEAKYFDVSN